MKTNKHIIEHGTFSGAPGKVNEVYKTFDGKKLADPEKDQEGWMQISHRQRRKVVAILISGASHNPLYGWEFDTN